MKKWFTILVAVLALTACTGGIKGPDRSTSNALGSSVSVTQSDVTDRAAGTNSAIDFTTGKLPDSREKEVLKFFIADQFRLLGQPRVSTQAEFQKAATLLLSDNTTERAKGDALRLQLANEAQALREKLASLETQYKAAREQEAAAHRAELEKVKLEADAAQKKFIAWIFFGGAFLLVAAGVVVLVTAAQVPMFGPKVGFGLIGAGMLAGVTGVIIIQLMKQLDAHPWILWAGVGGIVILLTGAGAIAYANHQHHVENA